MIQKPRSQPRWIGLGYWIGVLLTTHPVSAIAQITGDGTLGTQVNGSAIAPCTGLCTINGGTIQGSNLFHSFKDFSIPTGGQAWFDNGPQIQTIFSRVTGGNLSTIDGLIKTNGTASLFLLNPNGILFGPSARLDIGGSFLATTANAFTFANGSEFSATNPQAPPLLTLNVTPGLQWGQGNTATIVNRGHLSAGQDLILEASQLDLQGQLVAGRDLTLTAETAVKIRDTATMPFLAKSGRNLTIQGSHAIDIFALNHPNVAFQSGKALTLISNGAISADAHFSSGDTLIIQTLTSAPGNFISWFDPIIYAAGDVVFGDYVGVALKIEAGGNIEGGNITITGPDATIPATDPDFAILTGGPSVILRAGVTPTPISTLPQALGGTTFTAANAGSAGEINLVGISTASGVTNGGTVILSGTGNINVGAGGIASLSFLDGGNGGDVIITSTAGNISINGSVNASSQSFVGAGSGGSLTFTAAGNITVQDLNSWTNGGGFGAPIRLTSGGTVTSSFGLETSAFNGIGGGNIFIDAVGDIITTNLDTRSLNDGGTINLTSGRDIRVNFLDSSSTVQDGGAVNLLAAGNIIAATIDSGSFGAGQGGDITIASTGGSITTQRILRTDSFAGGAGQMQLTAAGNITTGDLNAATFASNDGGNIVINSGATFTATDSLILTGTAGAGNAGNIDIQAAAIALINSEVNSGTTGSGRAGDIILQGNSINLSNGTTIVTGTTGPGQGGNVTAIARDTFTLSGTSATGSVSQIATGTLGIGNAGNIAIETGRLSLRDGAIIATTTGDFRSIGSPAGQGGSLSVNADIVDIRGISPDGNSPSRLATASFSSSKAGDLSVKARQVSLQEGGILATSTFSSGRGGDLTVNAVDSISLDGSILSPTGRTPTAFSADTFGSGRAGDLTLNTPQLTVQNGAAISASTFATGQGGTLTANVTELVLLQGTDPDGFSSGLYAQATDQGDAGNLVVRSPFVQVRDRATITVASGSAANLNLATNTLKNITGIAVGTRPATGVAGTLSIQTNQLTLDNQGQLLASTDSGQGGNIDLAIRDVLLMRQSSLISATAGTAQSGGDGGNITINAPFVMAPPSENNDIIANAFTGRGGNVVINATSILNFTLNDKGKTFNQLRQQATNDISASSEFGSDGTLNLTGLNTDPAQGTVQLPSTTSIPQPTQGCQTASTSAQTAKAEFFTSGRGGRPASPSDPLSSSTILDDLRIPATLIANQRPTSPEALPLEMPPPETQTPPAIVEATHWHLDSQGRVVLSAAPIHPKAIRHCHLTAQPNPSI